MTKPKRMSKFVNTKAKFPVDNLLNSEDSESDDEGM
eukprot:CAMPEP_0205804078 /NCGR_PEP_ID=MMETSP0205-20121125/6855_1 /ASSEMBLY_ACC=CAM_ASM_000278 /TAXON_ID=36767 /ORGANISM="Euplotes focardii, Strain TN1" /LENGTH=35 /DNA_ID= /DNA_START= /DNA_END= /DNA_ORIENTATION=